jgi:undecaprenyl-diphosphatase
MLQQLIHWDHQLFKFINQDLANSFFDLMAPLLRSKTIWIPLYIFIWAATSKKLGWQAGLILLAGAGITIAITDSAIAQSFKYTFHRMRPCNNAPIQVRQLVKCGSGYSFISAHACNHFALAMFLYAMWGNIYKWILPASLIWAGAIAFSQVYVGVHFPADVTMGALLGSATGYLCGKIMYRRFFKKYIVAS